MGTELARDSAILRLTDREWSVIVTALRYAVIEEERTVNGWVGMAAANPGKESLADRVRDHSNVLAEMQAVLDKLEDTGV